MLKRQKKQIISNKVLHGPIGIGLGRDLVWDWIWDLVWNSVWNLVWDWLKTSSGFDKYKTQNGKIQKQRTFIVRYNDEIYFSSKP